MDCEIEQHYYLPAIRMRIGPVGSAGVSASVAEMDCEIEHHYYLPAIRVTIWSVVSVGKLLYAEGEGQIRVLWILAVESNMGQGVSDWEA